MYEEPSLRSRLWASADILLHLAFERALVKLKENIKAEPTAEDRVYLSVLRATSPEYIPDAYEL